MFKGRIFSQPSWRNSLCDFCTSSTSGDQSQMLLFKCRACVTVQLKVAALGVGRPHGPGSKDGSAAESRSHPRAGKKGRELNILPLMLLIMDVDIFMQPTHWEAPHRPGSGSDGSSGHRHRPPWTRPDRSVRSGQAPLGHRQRRYRPLVYGFPSAFAFIPNQVDENRPNAS